MNWATEEAFPQMQFIEDTSRGGAGRARGAVVAASVMLAVMATLAAGPVAATTTTPISTTPTSSNLPAKVAFVGHGWGHGRGMSQYGAYGYAVDHGWSGSMILNRFYRGTRTGTVPGGRQRVYLTAQDDKDLIVYNQLGRLAVSADNYQSTRSAIRIQRADDGHFRLFTGSSCNGPWREWSSLRSAPGIRIRPAANNDDPRAMLQLCGETGTRYYRGDLLAVRAGSKIQTVNDVGIEDLVRSVIAREISPTWADAGNGKGANAVRAQTVAARSYAMAGDLRFSPWATTCDSTLCQVYSGYASRAYPSSTLNKVEDSRTDAAVRGTRLQVRRFISNGRIARTEFSSSSGGFSAGGTFPIARDDGDDTVRNPNHDWTATVDRVAIEAAFDKREKTDLGTYQGTEVLARNGYGDMGGRVTRVRVQFSDGVVTLSGSQFRSTMGLKSDWFDPVAPTT